MILELDKHGSHRRVPPCQFFDCHVQLIADCKSKVPIGAEQGLLCLLHGGVRQVALFNVISGQGSPWPSHSQPPATRPRHEWRVEMVQAGGYVLGLHRPGREVQHREPGAFVNEVA